MATRRAARARRAPAGLTGRDTRVDMLRGVALLTMFVAHCAPSAGPLGLFNLSEYATAPLFALLIGVGAELGDRGNRGVPAAFVRAGIRAAVLVALGLWLDTWGAQVDIVLLYLALPTLLAPLLARLPMRYLIALGTVLWAAGPPLRDWSRERSIQAVAHGDELGARLWNMIAAGEHYRLTTLLVFVCLGIVVWRAHTGVRANVASTFAGLAALAVAALLLMAKAAGRITFEAYSGDHLEVAFTLALVGGLAAVWFSLVPADRDLSVLTAAGAMTLSIYVAQIGYLAWYVQVLQPGERDDAWSNVALLTAAALTLPVLWRRLAPNEPWAKGPIEGPTAVLTRLVR